VLADNKTMKLPLILTLALVPAMALTACGSDKLPADAKQEHQQKAKKREQQALDAQKRYADQTTALPQLDRVCANHGGFYLTLTPLAHGGYGRTSSFIVQCADHKSFNVSDALY
jgi:hypothetical protein